MKFSIIVPVYNIKNYLNKCVESLLDQKDVEYEILLIDDGSADGSGQVCDELANQYEIVSAYHKENGGLSDARNYGIDKARGDYLVFVDGDDYVESNFLGDISKKMVDGVDVVITRLSEQYVDKIEHRDDIITDLVGKKVDRITAIEWIMARTKNSWPAPKYIIKKCLIESKKLVFRKGFLHEDMDWTINLCIAAESFCFCDTIWYYHVKEREGSITNTVNPKRVTDVMTIAYDFLYGKNAYKLDKLEEHEQRLIQKRIMQTVYPALILCRKMQKRDIVGIAEKFREYQDMFQYAPKKKYKWFVRMARVIGFYPAIKIVSIIK